MLLILFELYLQRAQHYFSMAAESGNANANAFLGKVLLDII